jgi:hypothetical protein
VLALGAATARTAEAAPRSAPLPSFAGTTVITARGNGGIVMSLPRTATLDTRNRDPLDHAVTISRRGGSYAFVGLAEPDACRRYADPETRMCMAVHGYDLGQRPGVPDTWSRNVVTLDPPVVGKGRIEVYVLTDGEVTLTIRFKGLTGTRRVRADRHVTGWMHELPRTCPAPCEDVAFGGATHDVGRAGFVAAIAVATRDVDSAPQPSGTQFAESCIYRGTDAAGRSPEPESHPLGCDPVGGPLDSANTILNAPSSMHPMNNASGGSYYDYGGTGRVYVGFRGAVARTTGAWQSLAGYGVWVSEGIR